MNIKMLRRSAVCLLLIAAICISAVLPAMSYFNVSSWASAAVAEVKSLGLLPSSMEDSDMTLKITRLEMCRIAILAYEKITGVDAGAVSSGVSHFSDTKDPAAIAAYDLGIVKGFPDGTFLPNSSLTRQDFFQIVYALMTTGCYWDPNTVNAGDLTAFSDHEAVSNYAVAASQIMVSIGVVKGNADGTLNPKGTTTRQEALVMFLSAYKYLVKWNKQKEEEESFYTDDPVPPAPVYEYGFSNISTWAIADVCEMDSLGLIPSSLTTGDLTKGITRQQMCESAVLAYRKVTGTDYTASSTDYFTDTKDPFICAAYELKIISGYGNGKFGPSDVLTREQSFKIMSNFMLAVGYPRSDSLAVSLYNYSDSSRISTWAQSAARILIYIGAVKGANGKLTPKSYTSCQECLVMFLRCYKFSTSWLASHPGGVDDDSTMALIEDIVAFAKTYVGYNYVYGGKDPATGFDCSGLMYYVYHHFGYYIPRVATDQMVYSGGVRVSKSELQPGDLVFFSSSVGGQYAGHVGMYIGDGLFLHAANPSKGVIITSLSDSWYAARYIGAIRIVTKAG